MTEPKGQTRIQLKNRAVIREAALDVFSTYGFRGSTLDQIAKAAGLSKPNLLYYYPSKESIHAELLAVLMSTWLDPLEDMDDAGDPQTEILAYVRRKLQMSQDYPRESRLWANEILQGAPNILNLLENDLRELVDAKATVISGWVRAGKIAPVDPYHLLFSIWSLTQHYADFEIQIQAVLGDKSDAMFADAETFLTMLYTNMLQPLLRS
ncbi:TetR family transcriptional regulator C-terminal domain-containing protein [Algirhabdus cladophorae]|uniref:TetR family transcriptional regulator C-terminal domain-containing protein n=1 Tax=Algirhabdus cladophorae TaxID=3377108 RepID=UPI003B84A663